ncbi:MAG: hypothetical protein ACTS2F_22470 [Thainema sp.]
MPNQLPDESPYTSNGQPTQTDQYQLNGKGLNRNSTEQEDKKLQGFQQQTKRVLLTLLAAGLIVGALLSVLIIGAMQRFDLLDNQPQIEQGE